MVIHPDFVAFITLSLCQWPRHHTVQLTLNGLALASGALSIIRDSIPLIRPAILPLQVLLISSGSLNFRSDSLPDDRVVNTLLREVLEIWFIAQDYVF